MKVVFIKRKHGCLSDPKAAEMKSALEGIGYKVIDVELTPIASTILEVELEVIDEIPRLDRGLSRPTPEEIVCGILLLVILFLVGYFIGHPGSR